MTQMLLEADSKFDLNPFAQIARKQGIRVVYLKKETFYPVKKPVAPARRKIGIFNGIGDVIFKNDWEMSEEELLGVK
jgi:hypothetical protein